jgi:predicted RNase H-like nuclease
MRERGTPKNLVAGADAGTIRGRRGWVVTYLLNGCLHSIEFSTDLDRVVERADLTAIDIPIGLPGDDGVEPAASGLGRKADEEARQLLGARRTSVFPAPPLAVISANRYAEARELFPSLSAQSYSLRKRILEVRQLAERFGRQVVEYHPEVSFRMLNGQPLAHSKRSWNGLSERRNLLTGQGLEISNRLEGKVGGACSDDILDAAVGAITAAFVARGERTALGNHDAERHTRGVIWAPSGERDDSQR